MRLKRSTAAASLLAAFALSALGGCRPHVAEIPVAAAVAPSTPEPAVSPELYEKPAQALPAQASPVVPVSLHSVAPAQAAVVAQSAVAQAQDESKAFFEKGEISQLKIVLNQQEEQKLRADAKRFVECALVENGQTNYRKVAVKLKGAAGSFRHLDDRPAFTLKLKKKGERFHGMDKFHLNNSVQDESYLCELLGSQLFREAGYPAARITHARVWLNDRDLGIYVLKEGLDDLFLERNFGDAKGNMYDGGFCIDIDNNLEKDEGEGPEDYSDLKGLVAACREGDDAKRNQMIAEKLDVDAFLKYMALERLLCHWDGYVQNKNNYRIYFHNNQKAMFLPHGMDQLFQDTNFAVFNDPGQIVGSPIFRNAEWKSKYRRQVKELLPLFAPEKLHAKIDQAHARLRPVIASIDQGRAQHFDGRMQDLKNRVANRAASVQQQILSLPPEPIQFTQNATQLIEDWQPKAESDAKLERRNVGGEDWYLIETGPSNRTVASWRRKVLLSRGKYQIEAQGRVNNVAEIAGDPSGKGLGIRVSGGQRENHLVGSAGPQKVAHLLEIGEEAREVELVAELRSTSGVGGFKVNSMTITKLQ